MGWPLTYQDVWINGAMESKGQRECAHRYEMIRSVLEEYQQPITLLDIGAQAGYFGIRATEDFDCISILVDHNNVLHDVVRQHHSAKLIHIDAHLTAAQIIEWSQSEHFDVVLLMSVLHHLPDWEEYYQAAKQMASHVIVEVPGMGDGDVPGHGLRTHIEEAILKDEPTLLGATPSHLTGVMRPTYVVHTGPNGQITARNIDAIEHRGWRNRRYTVRNVGLTKSLIYIRDNEEKVRQWVQGMNLWNFVKLGGGWPDYQSIKAAILNEVVRLDKPHGDVVPWNFILQGQSVELIDGLPDYDPSKKPENDEAMLARTLDLIEKEYR